MHDVPLLLHTSLRDERHFDITQDLMDFLSPQKVRNNSQRKLQLTVTPVNVTLCFQQ